MDRAEGRKVRRTRRGERVKEGRRKDEERSRTKGK